MSEFDDWIGRSITASDTLDPARCNALDIALGGAGGLQIGDPMPLLDHWLHFWDMKPPSELGTDGHPAKGGFLPPVRLPRRMWAGGRLRYSALTMNGHRIHYDRPYAIEEEYYPGLVVHGPLQAKLMIRLAVAHLGDTITEFDFRGQQPAFDGLPLHICGNPGDRDAELWTQQGEAKNMVASVRTDR